MFNPLVGYAVSPEDIRKSFDEGAAFYIPKEEMANIELFLNDVLEAKLKGENTWSRWYSRLSNFSERAFGKEWSKNQSDLLGKMTFHV